MQSHQKPPRNVAHGALIVWEGAEDDEEVKLTTAGTLLKYFVRQAVQLQCPCCGRWLHPSWDHHQLFGVGPYTDLGRSQSHHLLGQLNIVGTQHPTISTLLQWRWMDLPSMNFILGKQFVLHCGQSIIKKGSQMDDSAKPTPFSLFLLFLQLLCLILIWFFQRQTF